MADATILDMCRHEVEDPRDEHYGHATLSSRRTCSTTEYFADLVESTYT